MKPIAPARPPFIWHRASLAIEAVMLLGLGLAVSSAPSVAATPSAASPSVATSPSGAAGRSEVAWAPCYQWLTTLIAEGEGRTVQFQCGQVQVPLDYDNPAGAQVLVSVMRVPATDPAHRVGSLFLNPGGPGGSGIDFTLFAGPYLYTDQVRAQFDLVGFDPRGIARSTQLRCAGSVRQIGGWFQSTPWPETSAEVAAWGTVDAAAQADCAKKGGSILDHMSTADVARDLDRLRAAVGDARLTYAGYSYGSYLGVTYANLFPQHVRALVVDGVLDPVAWSTGDPGQQDLPFSTRLRSDVGAEATLGEFFRLCDAAGTACRFGAVGGAAARYAALHRLLSTSPIVFPDGFVYDERFLVADTLGAMYYSGDWWFFADYLSSVEGVANGTTPLARAAFEVKRRSAGAGRGGFPHYPGAEGFWGVACSDSDNPDSLQAWVTAGRAREAVSRFGPLWTWVSSTCSSWPGIDADRYVGPWTARTAAPVLVVNNRYDPATPLHGADRVHALLPGSVQLTLEGWAHTTPFLSAALDAAVSRYLLTGAVPAPGTVFHQDLDPFAAPDQQTAASGLRARFDRALAGQSAAR